MNLPDEIRCYWCGHMIHYNPAVRRWCHPPFVTCTETPPWIPTPIRSTRKPTTPATPRKPRKPTGNPRGRPRKK